MKGFTLPELLITMAISALIIGATVAVSNNTLNNEEMSRTRETIRNELVAARSYAINGNDDSAWGVAFATSVIVLFHGNDYATRNAAFDKIESFVDNISLSGPSQIIFTRPNGIPQTTGTIVITDGNQYSTTTINEFGGLDIE